MKVLVTGGSGFLGHYLVEHLQTKGHDVTALSSKSCDLRSRNDLLQYSASQCDQHWDQIYHLAAWTQAGDFCLRHPGEQWIINQEINTNVLAWWQADQPQAKMIAIGTSCCYEPGTPHTEENFLKGQPIESLYTYAMTKRMLLVGLQSLHKQFGLNYLFLVPSTLYGAEYHLDGRQMHFIFDLLRKIVNGSRDGSPVVLWGDGHQKRELIHVRDFVAAAYDLAISRTNEVFNIGGGVEYSIRWYAQHLAEIVGYPVGDIQYDISKYVGATSKCLNIERLQQALPHFKPMPSEQGLLEIADWYLKST